MRRSASEKMEIIRLVEEAGPARFVVTLRQTGRAAGARSTAGISGTKPRVSTDWKTRSPAARPCWNAIPETVRGQVLDLALECTDLSPRELACRYLPTTRRYFVSESSVYRILKEADLITSPAYVLMSASDCVQESHDARA